MNSDWSRAGRARPQAPACGKKPRIMRKPANCLFQVAYSGMVITSPS